MSAIRRHEMIMEQLLLRRSVTVNELSALLGVTGKTIRDDLGELEAKGLLARVHGGAVLARESDAGLLPSRAPNTKALAEKARVAKMALTHVEEGDVIALDGGGTTLEMARQLGNMPLTVITNDLFIISELVHKDNIRLVVPGGFRSRNLLVGESTAGFIRKLNVGKSFVSTTGIHLEYGLSIYTSALAEPKRVLIECARSVYCVADHGKFDKSALITFARCDEIGLFVTDPGLPPDIAAKYAAAGIRIQSSSEGK
ncbi:MAG: DeoR/GlpR transcriptional regulator [Paenibacillaceae bacterium]|nr:DeoR/GlpR transcriptional regulator [Paenibacillaceae bacterium]